MSFSEKTLTSIFSKYYKSHPNDPNLQQSMAIEFKYLKGKTCNLTSHLQPQQIPSLLNARYNSLYHKISDMSVSLKPFDSFLLFNTPAFLALCFQTTKHLIFFIPINIVLACQLRNNKITLQDAISYSQFTINLSI